MTSRIILGVVLAVAFGAYVSHSAFDYFVRLPRRRRQWTATHPAVDDAEWVRRLGLPAARHAVAIALRETVAEYCGVPAETIAPDSSFIDLETRLTSDGLDPVGIVMSLEDLLRLSIPDKLAEKLPAPGTKFETVGDWVRDFMPKWDVVESLLTDAKVK